MNSKWITKISLISRGARYQMVVAICLVAVLPLLTISFLALPSSPLCETYCLSFRAAMIAALLILAASGYSMLLQYPRNILKLRSCLQKIAAGEMPEKITLLHSEDDIVAIENYLNTVVADLRQKVRLLQEQLQLTREMHAALEAHQNALLEAERQRVMIQSLGAACHHIGQPATLLCAHFDLLKKQAHSPVELAEVMECTQAVDAITAVIERLHHISEYRTVPYLTFQAGKKPDYATEILDIATPQS